MKRKTRFSKIPRNVAFGRGAAEGNAERERGWGARETRGTAEGARLACARHCGGRESGRSLNTCVCVSFKTHLGFKPVPYIFNMGSSIDV